MTTPITLPPLDEQSLSDLRHRYDEASDAETRTRYQMLLLSAKGQTSTQIARLVLRSQECPQTVLHGRIGCCPPTNRSRPRSKSHSRLGS